MVINRVGAGAADEDVSAAVAVNRIRAGAARYGVISGRAEDRHRGGDAAGVQAGEAEHAGSARRRLIAGAGQVDANGRAEVERAGAGAAVQRRFRAVIINQVRARAGGNDVRPAVAVDGFRARAACDRVGAARAENREGAAGAGRIHVGEAGDRRRAGCRLIGEIGEIQIDVGVEHQRVRRARAAGDRGLAAMVIDGVGAGATDDHIAGSAIAIDRIRTRAAGDGVGADRADNGQRAGDAARIHIGESENACRTGGRLIGAAGEIQVHGRIEIQRTGARAAVDRRFAAVIIDEIGAGTRVDDVGAAAAIDGLRAGTAGNGIAQRRADDRYGRADRGRRDIGEIRHRRAAADLTGRPREIHVGRHREIERARARAAVNRRLASVIIDQVRARAAIDDVASAVAVDGLRTRAAGDRIGARRTEDRKRAADAGGVDIGEILERRGTRTVLIAGIGEIEADAGVKDQRVDAAGTAVDRGFAAVIVDRVAAGAADDDVARAAAAIDSVGAAAAGDRVRACRSQDRQRAADAARIDIREAQDVR